MHSKRYLKEAIRHINTSNKQMSGSEMISALIDKLMSNNSDNEFSCQAIMQNLCCFHLLKYESFHYFPDNSKNSQQINQK